MRKNESSTDDGTPSKSGAIPFTEPITPPAFADYLSVNENKILHWIHSGALTAINVATETSTRPRWRILPVHAEEFLASRRAVQPPKQQRRTKSASGAKSFF